MIAVILAGGKGQRMGCLDKGAMVVGGMRLIDRVIERIAPQGAVLKISGPHDYGLGLDVLPDLKDGPKGPAAGIYAAFKSLEESAHAGFFTVPVDGPALPKDLLARLYCKDRSAVAQDDSGLHPTYAWWRMEDLRAVWGQIDLADSLSLKKLAARAEATYVRWPGEMLFANINTSDDLSAYLSSQ